MDSEDDPPAPRPRRRANDLDGAAWTRNSISVWNDLRKTPEEKKLGHPAAFPAALAKRLIECFLGGKGKRVLDPFAGTGSTLAAAYDAGHFGIGFEISAEYRETARARLESVGAAEGRDFLLHAEPAQRAGELAPEEGYDLLVTSPPYWNIMGQKRTADLRAVRDYQGSNGSPHDLSRLEDYEEYLSSLTALFLAIAERLNPGAYCVIDVMDLRRKDRFFPLHADLAQRLSGEGSPFVWDDLIVWDRRSEYNRLRPLGYPAVFRINKIHEFLLIFRRRGISTQTDADGTD